jgi:hypothetical protein
MPRGLPKPCHIPILACITIARYSNSRSRIPVWRVSTRSERPAAISGRPCIGFGQESYSGSGSEGCLPSTSRTLHIPIELRCVCPDFIFIAPLNSSRTHHLSARRLQLYQTFFASEPVFNHLQFSSVILRPQVCCIHSTGRMGVQH